VTASEDCTVRVWELPSGRQLAQCSGHTEPVQAARFSHDGNRIVSASWDGTARLWDPATGSETGCVHFKMDGTVRPDERLLDIVDVGLSFDGRSVLVQTIRGNED